MSETKSALKELRAIKKLLILLLIKSNATSEEIGETTDVDSSLIRKMFPMRRLKKSGV